VDLLLIIFGVVCLRLSKDTLMLPVEQKSEKGKGQWTGPHNHQRKKTIDPQMAKAPRMVSIC
jgi:hypothetical protein